MIGKEMGRRSRRVKRAWRQMGGGKSMKLWARDYVQAPSEMGTMLRESAVATDIINWGVAKGLARP